MQAKWALARQSFLLLLMWPLTLALGLIDTLQHTLLNEPLDYRARKLATAGLGRNTPTMALNYPCYAADELRQLLGF